MVAVGASFDIDRNLIFNTGECVHEDDLNGLVTYTEHQSLIQSIIRDTMRYTTPVNVRPIRDCFEWIENGLAVDFRPGQFLYWDGGAWVVGRHTVSVSETVPTPTNSQIHRYSLAISNATATITRHFEDATTRAKSSQTVNKYDRLTLTINRTSSTDVVSPTAPAWPVGEIPLYQVTANSGGNFSDRADYRVPAGITEVLVPGVNIKGANWSAEISGISGGRYGTTGTDKGMLPVPSQHNRHLRLGIAEVLFSSGGATRIWLASTDSVGTFGSSWTTLASSETFGKTNYRAQWAPDMSADTPLWCNGASRPDSYTTSLTDLIFLHSLALGVQPTSTPDLIRAFGVRFYGA